MKGSNLVVRVVTMVIYCCCVSWSFSGDVAADRKECTDPLTALAPCLTFVQGNGAHGTPTPDCCRATRMLVTTNIKCLCILINDRDTAGIAFNVTTAIHLPALCQATVNATHCIDLLQLPANSPDAQFFKQLSNTTSGIPTPPVSTTAGRDASAAGAGPAKSGRTEPRGAGLVGVWKVFLWFWFTMLADMAI